MSTSTYRGHEITIEAGPATIAWNRFEATWTGQGAGSVYGKDRGQAIVRARQQIDRAIDGPAWQNRKAYAYQNR